MKSLIRSMKKLATRRRAFGLAALVIALAGSTAMPVPIHAEPAEVWDAERAVAGMERLRAEIGILTGLAAAQGELVAWNRLRAETGSGPAVLPVSLCVEAALAPWCLVLPATFGARTTDPGTPLSQETLPARRGQTEDENR